MKRLILIISDPVEGVPVGMEKVTTFYFPFYHLGFLICSLFVEGVLGVLILYLKEMQLQVKLELWHSPGKCLRGGLFLFPTNLDSSSKSEKR